MILIIVLVTSLVGELWRRSESYACTYIE